MVAPPHPYFDPPRPRAFAHRGWHVAGDADPGDAPPENTLAAFRRAAREGYAYCETDVHTTADGVLVVHHDATLRRMTALAGALRTTTWTDLATAGVGGRVPMARLEEVLEALPDMRFNVDLKSPGSVAPMTALLEDDDVARRVAVASTDDARLAAVRRRFGDRVVTGVATRAALGLRARSVLPPGVRALGVLAPVRGRMAQLPERVGALPVVDRLLVRAAHDQGVEVHVWTVDDAAAMARLLDLGVDGLMTDRPDRLREVLHARGAWHPRGV